MTGLQRLISLLASLLAAMLLLWGVLEVAARISALLP